MALRGRPTILAMIPGTRVVSTSFTMEEWEAHDNQRGAGLSELLPRVQMGRAGQGRRRRAARRGPLAA